MANSDNRSQLDALLSAYEAELLNTPDSELAAPSEVEASEQSVRPILEAALALASKKREVNAPQPRRKRPSLRSGPPVTLATPRPRLGVERLRATFSASEADDVQNDGPDDTDSTE